MSELDYINKEMNIDDIKNEKKDDPEYSILPIIARDLKHVKGHLSFMQVRRDIRGKRGGDNWQIHEYAIYF